MKIRDCKNDKVKDYILFGIDKCPFRRMTTSFIEVHGLKQMIKHSKGMCRYKHICKYYIKNNLMGGLKNETQNN